MHRPPYAVLLRAAGPICLIAVSGAATATQLLSLVSPTPLADRDGFAAAVKQIETELATHDAFVVVWPPEQYAALATLPPSWNAADAVPLPATARDVIVVGPARFNAPPELGDAMSSGRQRFSQVEVARFSFAAMPLRLFDLQRNLDQVAVRMRHDTGVLECDVPRPGGGWTCPHRPPWNYVGPTRLRVAGRDWAAVWAHPITGETLELDLGQQMLGDTVRLEAALSDDAANTVGGARVSVSLDVEGVGKRELLRTNTTGIVAVEMDTRAARSQRAGIRIQVLTANDGRRHLGLNLTVTTGEGAQ